MIRYTLRCDRSHSFEAWFNHSGDYDKQAKRGLVTCPICDSNKVEKALMAPQLAGTRKTRKRAPEAAGANAAPSPVAMMSPQEREFRVKLKELRDHIVANAENVGKEFSTEARKMHYGEIEHRSIYGEASGEEAKALAEEGIEFHPLPVLPEDRN
ncbi:MAG: DUF1178 family protein [Pseudorhodoplanes sp.]